MNENNLICNKCLALLGGYRHFRRFGAVQRIVFDLENERYGPCRISIMAHNLNVRESGQTLWPLEASPPVVVTAP